MGPLGILIIVTSAVVDIFQSLRTHSVECRLAERSVRAVFVEFAKAFDRVESVKYRGETAGTVIKTKPVYRGNSGNGDGTCDNIA